MGIAINSKGNILVSDSGNHIIQEFDSKGKLLSIFGSKGSENGQFIHPTGICIDENDNILICDHYNDRIQIFNSNRKYITQFKVNQPTNIIINPKTQNIIICGLDNQVSFF